MNYYNEIDHHAAQWLRNLIEAELIPNGVVDERSIAEVVPDDLKGFTQVHFFAGIGGWSYALKLAGWPNDRPVWTGSCPCQPFSNAGKREGQADERHLWPEMYRLIRERKPTIVFGEQVASAIGHGWLDGISDDLEAQNYSVGAIVLPACSVGAPHIRQRLFWLADSRHGSAWRPARSAETESGRAFSDTSGHGKQRLGRMADCISSGLEKQQCDGRIPQQAHAGIAREDATGSGRLEQGSHEWADFDIVYCADGKYRRIESGSQPLVNGVSFRLADGRTLEGASRQEIFKGIGNAIVPQVAAEFILSFMR